MIRIQFDASVRGGAAEACGAIERSVVTRCGLLCLAAFFAARHGMRVAFVFLWSHATGGTPLQPSTERLSSTSAGLGLGKVLKLTPRQRREAVVMMVEEEEEEEEEEDKGQDVD